MWGYGHMAGFGFFGWIWQILFLVLIIWGIASLFRHGRHVGGCCGSEMKNGKYDSSASAMETLKNRYAKGEINKEDFERMKKDLG